MLTEHPQSEFDSDLEQAERAKPVEAVGGIEDSYSALQEPVAVFGYAAVVLIAAGRLQE